jgi:hypothetical protein
MEMIDIVFERTIINIAMEVYKTNQWDHVDIDLSCTAECGNPFDVKLWARFESDGTQPVRIPGFYRGNARWTVRFMPPASGVWEFATESEIAGLHGLTGRVKADSPRPANHGRLRPIRDNPRFLCWEDGTSYLMIGFEADWLALADVGSEECRKAQALIDVIASNGLNHVFMNVYAHDVPWPGDLGRGTRFDFSCSELWPFGGTNDEPDYEVLNPVYFDNLDRVVVAMREKGIVCHLMIYVWNKKVNWPEKDSVADRRFFDYVVARYQGFSNILWDVSKEALTYGYCTADYIENKCSRIRDLDGHDHLLTVHDRPFCEDYPDAVDIISVQDWRSELYSLMIEMRGRYGKKPLFNIEHGGYEESPFINAPGDYQDPAVCLERNYICMFAGAYSTYYWQGCSWNIVCYDPLSLPPEKQPNMHYFRYMQDFFRRYPFERFAPVSDLRVVSSGYALFDGQHTLLVLKPQASYCTHLRGFKEAKEITVSWFNPITGAFSDPLVLAMERSLPLRSPWNDVFTIACIELR